MGLPVLSTICLYTDDDDGGDVRSLVLIEEAQLATVSLRALYT